MDSEKKTVKYFVENEFCREPYQASEDAAGYDLFAAKTLTLFPVWSFEGSPYNLSCWSFRLGF